MPDVEEEKPEPDLDELLELFREPEEEPRRRGVPGSVWLMLAMMLSLGGAWLAFVNATGGSVEKATGPPVLPTKVSDRTVREEPAEAVDVVEEFSARCRKGMNGREVRWIVEDFQQAGLTTEPGSLYGQIEELIGRIADNPGFEPQGETLSELERASMKLAHRQRAWYGDTLADGLHLDADQRKSLSQRMKHALDSDQTRFHERLGAFAREAPAAETDILEKIVGGIIGHQMLVERPTLAFLIWAGWLAPENYAPWELSELTESQLQVTRHQSTIELQATIPEDETAPWFLFRPAMVVGTPGDDRSFELFGYIRLAESIFPLVEHQSAAILEKEILDLAKGLHPAQLKTLLMLEPEVASELLHALEESGE